MRLSVRLEESLARHTPLRTGGCCEAWVVAHDIDALAAVVSECRKASWRLHLIGAGTRTVVRDGPVPGAVLRLGSGFMRIDDEGETWSVGGAVPVPALVARARTQGLGGLEAVSTVPGSVGASVLLDEGWSAIVQGVQILRRGKAAELELDEVVGRRNAIVVGVRLRLPETTVAPTTLGAAALAPPGSWYTPTRGEPVRDVFRSVRLHMVRLRQVAIPDAAPELLVNLGGGTAADLALLSRSAFERVKKVRGDQLEHAIRWMGSAVKGA